MPRLPKYEIRSVTPKGRRIEALSAPAICLGISLDNPRFKGPHLEAIFNWIELHYTRCLIFIGDYLYKYTLAITQSFPTKQAQRAVSPAVYEFNQQLKTRLN